MSYARSANADAFLLEGSPRRRRAAGARRGILGAIARARGTLGDAWTDYLATGRGPAGGTITSPDGEVLYFDSEGGFDRSAPPVRTDATIVKDPSSSFYGWTELQKAAFYAAQGSVVYTDALKAKVQIVDGVPTLSEADVAANQAKLQQLALKDPTVTSALTQVAAGIAFGSDVAERSAASVATNDAQLRVDGRAQLDSIIAKGGVFTDTIKPGAVYPDYVLRGMISTTQWLEDYVSVARGGKPSNAIAAKGKLPSGIPVAPPEVMTAHDAGAVVKTMPASTANNVATARAVASAAGAIAGSASWLPWAIGGGALLLAFSRRR